MKRFAIIPLAAAAASTFAMGIGSGNVTGTNYPMVENLIKVCGSAAGPFENIKTAGSLENLDRTFSDSTMQFGITQLDAAKYYAGSDPKSAAKLKAVLPFFTTEIHLLVRDGVKANNLADIKNLRVIEGPDGSGTWVSVQVIKKLTGLTWQGSLASQADGLKALQAGQADAMFIVAGKPIGMLMGVMGVHLISVQHPALDNFSMYTSAMLTAGDYPGLSGTIRTYKMQNALMTFDFGVQYQQVIFKLVQCLQQKLPELQNPANGYHTKWRSVDPKDLETFPWPVHPQALKALGLKQK
jgi:TRAP transporter TAXI family solute receptor